jgi:Carbohydrate family 9 binding domain-like
MSAAGMLRVSRVAAVALAVVSSHPLTAQSSRSAGMGAPSGPRPIVAMRSNAPLTIDGRLDEPIWRQVRPATHFVQRDPTDGAAATLVTDVRMLITDSAVVIGARMDDDYRTIFSALGPPTDGAAGGYLDDYFEIQIDAHREHLTSFAFNLTPKGDRRTWIIGRDGARDASWNLHWESSTRIDAKGWTVEVRIPISEFHVDPGSENWGVQFVRFSWRRQETDVFRGMPSVLLQTASVRQR